jgi:four helix bundle protein
MTARARGCALAARARWPRPLAGTTAGERWRTAYDLALDLVRQLREPLAAIRRHDPDLAKQAMRALASVPLNIAEAKGRTGRDRLHHFRIAVGSLRELDVAAAFGWFERAPLVAERDRLCAVLYGLQR